jgi:hypothetical protein
MNAAIPTTSGAIALARQGRISPTAAFFLQASITVSFLASSSAPTPLYATYQSEWGFSPVMVTIVFAFTR